MTHRGRLAVIVLAGLLVLGPRRGDSAPDGPPKYEPTENYEPRKVEGWDVLVNRKFLSDQPELADRALTLLRFQLYQVARRLPADAVEEVRKVRIWVEENEPHHPCMVYHPDAGWLRGHGMNPDKARCVEISNARKFLAWTFDQPWMVLHELAHGYHDRVLEGGYGNAELKAAFDRAAEGGLYRSVLRVGGKEEKAYAATNPMEYFAEATEAFFGTNDFFPFVRPELERHDPEMAALLAKLWRTAPATRR